MKLLLFLIPLLIIQSRVSAQLFKPLKFTHTIDSANITSQTLFSDSLSSSFVITIKKKVPLHKHAEHTEQVYVLAGKGRMTLGDSAFSISKGDLIAIPRGTPHSLTVTSRRSVKVISLQSPRFDGKDRILLE